MALKYSNNAKTTVSVAGISGTLINVADASTFPVIDSVDDYTYITLLAGSTAQIFKAHTIDHANNVILVDVAPDSAVFIPTSTRVELRLTAELLSGLMDTHEHTFNDITGVSLSTPSQNQVLTYNGAAWTNAAPTTTASSTLLDGGDATGTFAGVTVAAASSGGSEQGVTVYPDAAALASATLVTGAMAYIQDIDKLLLCTGTAWSSVAISNAPPTASFSSTDIDSHYQIPGWPGHDFITITAADPDGVVPEVTVLSDNMPGVTIDIIGNSLIKVTPDTSNEYAGNFVIQVSDGEHVILQTITVVYAFSQNIVGQQNFFTSGTWTAPDFVDEVSYMLIGGGQGGKGVVTWFNGMYSWPSYGNSSHLASNGSSMLDDYYSQQATAGERVIGTLSVTPNTTYQIVVGTGSSGNTGPFYSGGSWANWNSPTGGDTSFGTIVADGGAYGVSSGNGASADDSWVGSNTGAIGTTANPTNTLMASGTYVQRSGGSGKNGAVRLIWGDHNGSMRSFAGGGNGTGDL